MKLLNLKQKRYLIKKSVAGQTTDLKKFEEFAYPDQMDALMSMNGKRIGQIIDPTGMGKSFIAQSKIALNILQAEEPTVYSMASPTKVLGAQLLTDTMVNMAKLRIEKVSFVTLNSGIQTTLRPYSRQQIRKYIGQDYIIERSTTSKEKLKEIIQKNKEKGYHTIVSSTYHSIHRLLQAVHMLGIKIKTHINDEPQKLVSNQFNELSSDEFKEPDDPEFNIDQHCKNLQAHCEEIFNFTATPKKTAHIDGIGMQNEKRFGPILYSITEKEAYKLGRKVPPRLVRLKGLDFEVDNPKSMGLFVSLTFLGFQQQWTKYDRDMPVRLLVDTGGCDRIRWFMESEEYTLLKKRGINIAHCDSTNGYWVNDIQYNDASEWQNAVNDISQDEKLIVLHVDMLVEGLDIDGLNSLLLSKSRSSEQLKQLIGRIQRLLSKDRDMVGIGKNYKPMDLLDTDIAKKFKKPFGLVAIADNKRDLYQYASDLIKTMRTDFGIPDDKIYDFGEWVGSDDEDDNNTGFADQRKERKKAKAKMLKKFYRARMQAETETEMYSKASPIDKLKIIARAGADFIKKF